MDRLKAEDVKARYQSAIRNRFEALPDMENIDEEERSQVSKRWLKTPLKKSLALKCDTTSHG